MDPIQSIGYINMTYHHMQTKLVKASNIIYPKTEINK